MNAQTDQQLLRDYAGSHSEAAFAELVRRHIDLVYSAALRMVCDSHQAEDVTQGVFVALAQNARQLTRHPVLSGWLHRTTQNLAANAVRTNVRRQTREQEAAAMNELLSAGSDVSWENIASHLDAALGELSEPDRDALLLRYFERKSAREMAHTLGTTEEAAQKRVSRAVERLREFFAKRGITVGASGLVVVITANAVQAAPAGLTATIVAAVALVGTGISTAAMATTRVIAMTAPQKVVITVAILAALGVGIYETLKTSSMRAEVRALQREQAAEIQRLQQELDQAASQLMALRDERERLGLNTGELLKLRGEVTQLRADARDREQLKTAVARTTNTLPLVAGIVITNIGAQVTSSREEIRAHIRIKAGDIFERAKVDLDVRELFETGLFSNVQVTDLATRDGVILTYLLHDRPRLADIRIAGSTKYDEAELKKMLTSRIGDPLNEMKLFNDSQEIETLYRETGHPGTAVKYVTQIDEQSGRGVVTFEVKE